MWGCILTYNNIVIHKSGMLFETLCDSNGVDHVELFIEALEDETAEKVLKKLEAFEQLTFAEHMSAEHIKKIEGKLFEVRIRINADCYRFFGTTRGDTFYMVHAIKKKADKPKRKDIDLAVRRISNLN